MQSSTMQRTVSGVATSSNLEAQPQSGSLRRRQTLSNTPVQRGIARVGTIMGQAHAQDFERKRRPGILEPASPYHGARVAGEESSDDEDDEEAGERGDERRADEEDIKDAEEILRRHRSATDGGT